MKARFAPIVPPEMLLDMKELGILGDYHLLLAHEVVANPSLYRQVFQGCTGLTIIVDNGVIELGEPVSEAIMEEALRTVPARYIILPDAVGNAAATVNLAKSTTVKKYISLAQVYSIQLMGVVQGRSEREILWCAEQLKDILGLTAWGIPRIITATHGTRSYVLDTLRETWPDDEFHLLGFSDSQLDDIACARMPGVMGIDSSLPTLLGMMGRSIHIDNWLPDERPYRKNGEWPSAVWRTQIGENINKVREWLR